MTNEIDELMTQEYLDGHADGTVAERERGTELLEVYKARSRNQVIGAGLGVVIFGAAALHFAFQSGRTYEREHNPDSIKAPANPGNGGEETPYLPPRVRHAPVIVRPPVTPIEIPVRVDAKDDGLVPIDWNTSSSL
ncbi:MAG: hypothetical protein AAB544_05490 [Patescibacteria group bacterium]